ncbi:hypothetical protein Rs2_15972 [Raphanus sativus]|nr:hypothetical protein Rs2_15972 [Raphanus sativus]
MSSCQGKWCRTFIFPVEVCSGFHAEDRLLLRSLTAWWRGINMLFVLGGSGKHAGANAIPNEADSAYHGIGVVKLMGRSSGFIAMQASLASGQVDICLFPEVPFKLHGPDGVLKHLNYLIETIGSAVVCFAEGAGQSFLENTNAKDASGNKVLGDIGVHINKKFVSGISNHLF